MLKQLFPRKKWPQLEHMLELAKKYREDEYGFYMIPRHTILSKEMLFERLERKYKLPKESIYMKFIDCLLDDLSQQMEEIIYLDSRHFNDVFQI